MRDFCRRPPRNGRLQKSRIRIRQKTSDSNRYLAVCCFCGFPLPNSLRIRQKNSRRCTAVRTMQTGIRQRTKASPGARSHLAPVDACRIERTFPGHVRASLRTSSHQNEFFLLNHTSSHQNEGFCTITEHGGPVRTTALFLVVHTTLTASKNKPWTQSLRSGGRGRLALNNIF